MGQPGLIMRSFCYCLLPSIIFFPIFESQMCNATVSEIKQKHLLGMRFLKMYSLVARSCRAVPQKLRVLLQERSRHMSIDWCIFRSDINGTQAGARVFIVHHFMSPFLFISPQQCHALYFLEQKQSVAFFYCPCDALWLKGHQKGIAKARHLFHDALCGLQEAVRLSHNHWYWRQTQLARAFKV